MKTFVLFPFLKTSGPIGIGRFTFHSTDDIAHLAVDERKQIEQIKDMLFLQDNLRIKSASYCVVPLIELNREANKLEDLINLHAIVAYRYAAPHPVSGDLFLSAEHASIAIMNSQDVSIHLVNPDHNVVRVGEQEYPPPNERQEVPGYAGLYNFREHFWVTRGSRLYGPRRQLTLNISQDLKTDFETRSERPDYGLLLRLLTRPRSDTNERILTAIRWFNAANEYRRRDDASAIVNLAIAFETLLGLPEPERKIEGITDRLTDAISLLLGRTPRLDTWARQFYKTRSEIVHQGRARRMRFLAPSSKKGEEGALYHPLLSFGRQLFQMCVGVLLVGERFAETAGLEDKLVTNQERFESLCRILADKSILAAQRLASCEATIFAIERYRFVWESDLRIETMLGATRMVVEVIAQTNSTLPAVLKDAIDSFVTAPKGPDHFEELDKLRQLKDAFPEVTDSSSPLSPLSHVGRLVDVVWGSSFMHYYWLKQKREASK